MTKSIHFDFDNDKKTLSKISKFLSKKYIFKLIYYYTTNQIQNQDTSLEQLPSCLNRVRIPRSKSISIDNSYVLEITKHFNSLQFLFVDVPIYITYFNNYTIDISINIKKVKLNSFDYFKYQK